MPIRAALQLDPHGQPAVAGQQRVDIADAREVLREVALALAIGGGAVAGPAEPIFQCLTETAGEVVALVHPRQLVLLGERFEPPRRLGDQV